MVLVAPDFIFRWRRLSSSPSSSSLPAGGGGGGGGTFEEEKDEEGSSDVRQGTGWGTDDVHFKWTYPPPFGLRRRRTLEWSGRSRPLLFLHLGIRRDHQQRGGDAT